MTDHVLSIEPLDAYFVVSILGADVSVLKSVVVLAVHHLFASHAPSYLYAHVNNAVVLSAYHHVNT